jgi:hypothetical protein
MKTQADLLNFRVAELLTFRLPKTIGGSGTAAPLVWLKKSAVTNPDKFRSSAKWGFWTPAMQVVKGGWNQTTVISAFRCKNCGYLEAYAK